MWYVIGLIVIAAIAVPLWIRLAPSDPAVWHVAITDEAEAMPGPCASHVRTLRNGARATCLLAEDPSMVLAKLDAMARATPRTAQLAATDGLTTWITRSRLMGFPDYTTAQLRQTDQGTRLDVFARQRFGENDLGVNTARLRTWLTGL